MMHVKKNVCDRLVGTLLNFQVKRKDGKHSCLNKVVLDIRQELALEELGKRIYFPPICHTFSKKEKKL